MLGRSLNNALRVRGVRDKRAMVSGRVKLLTGILVLHEGWAVGPEIPDRWYTPKSRAARFASLPGIHGG